MKLTIPQIHFGAQIPPGLMAVLAAKAPNPQTLRKIVLEGHRFTPKEAHELGLVDHIVAGNTESLLAEAGLAGQARVVRRFPFRLCVERIR